MTYNIFAKPVLKLGGFLGTGYVLAQYLFYFSGKSIIQDDSFNGAIQLLTILGLYMALLYCRRLYPPSSFWKLFLFGIVIMGVAIVLKTIFSILLYTLIDPELAIVHKELLLEQMSTIFKDMDSFPQDQYQETSKMMLNGVSMPLMEGFSLFITGTIFSAFISAILNMFRRR
ncbi:uncharacterized protein DUF4199 [Balneicella halophila]|uniref:Uncharacterized protein DUF4199 n=1 Tax=Balneicella halophila TaxID=1537566 RepID=A0A7L4URE4_BALHA|nr:DUF4199 domain-containing protein [Balneicella halophila]PVX50889.1 uncharacterized protein DUF4199 [Balneicella halophila]